MLPTGVIWIPNPDNGGSTPSHPATKFTIRKKKMKVFIAIVCVCALGLVISFNTQSHHTQKDPSLLVVTRIIDGDTLVGNYQGVSETVRLIGVNAPETGACYSKKSRDYLHGLTYKKRLRAEQGQTKRDKYGRLLLYIYDDANDAFINDKLTRAGAAYVMTVGNNTQYAGKFSASANYARHENAGVWGGC